jgi:hypothetical protein
MKKTSGIGAAACFASLLLCAGCSLFGPGGDDPEPFSGTGFSSYADYSRGNQVLFTSADAYINEADSSEVVFRFGYTSDAAYEAACFDPPDGTIFRLPYPGGIQPGSGSVYFGIPRVDLQGLHEITCRANADDSKAEFLVFSASSPGFAGLRTASIPSADTGRVRRFTAGNGFTVTMDCSKSTNILFTAADAYVNAAQPSEVIFCFDYSSNGVYEVSCFDPPNGVSFSLSKWACTSAGVGSVYFGVPATKLTGITTVTCLTNYSVMDSRESLAFLATKAGFASLRVASLPASAAVIH